MINSSKCASLLLCECGCVRVCACICVCVYCNTLLNRQSHPMYHVYLCALSQLCMCAGPQGRVWLATLLLYRGALVLCVCAVCCVYCDVCVCDVGNALPTVGEGLCCESWLRSQAAKAPAC